MWSIYRKDAIIKHYSLIMSDMPIITDSRGQMGVLYSVSVCGEKREKARESHYRDS